MLQRVITGALIAVVVITILLSDIAVVSAFVGILILVAQYEMSKVTGVGKTKILLYNNLVFSAAFVWILFFEKTQHITVLFHKVAAAFVLYVIFLFMIMILNFRKVKFSDIVFSLFGMIYITASMLHIPAVRNIDFGNLYIYLIFIGAFATDTCAYFVGVFFGKHKLCEKISPKKTIEGAIGGEIGTILFMLLFGYVISKTTLLNVNYFLLAIIGVISGIVSQLGDLTASIIKREFGVKDYGNILPGHGGVMDRLDSIILMAPLVYHFVTFFPIFTDAVAL